MEHSTRNTQHVVAEIGVISAVRPPETAAETYATLAEPGAELIAVAFQWHG